MKPRGNEMVRLCQVVARDLGDGVTAARLEEHRESFVALTAEGDFSSRVPRFRTVIAIAAVLVAGLFAVLFWPQNDTIVFWVGEEKLSGKAGTWLEAPETTSYPVSFEQGSRIILKNNATARVASSTQEEVSIDLNRGEILANISGNGRTQWHVDAGPFRVTVLGTVFTVAWELESNVLDVTVKQGKVLVRGAGLNEHGITVQKGNHLRADSRTGFVSLNSVDSKNYDPAQPSLLALAGARHEIQQGEIASVGKEHTNADHLVSNPVDGLKEGSIDGAEGGARTASTSKDNTKNYSSNGVDSRAAGRSTSRRSIDSASNDPLSFPLHRWPSERPVGSAISETESLFNKIAPILSAPKERNTTTSQTDNGLEDDKWLMLYREGRYAAAVREAEAQGFQSLIETLDCVNLWKLVDATRSAERVPLSVDALLAYRTRFSTTNKANVATFLLGKIHSDQLSDEATATQYFKRYLREDANGSLAEEALGRLIRLCNNLGRIEEAQGAARQYLRKYPNGSFKDVARAVQDGL